MLLLRIHKEGSYCSLEVIITVGLMAGNLELFGIFSGEDMHYIYPNGDEVSNIDIVFVCHDYKGKLQCQEGEVDELRFFELDEIPENISPMTRRALSQWLAGK